MAILLCHFTGFRGQNLRSPSQWWDPVNVIVSPEVLGGTLASLV